MDKKVYILISFLITFYLSYPSSYALAQKSQEYIKYAIDRIYRDCGGYALKVEGHFLSYFPLPFLANPKNELSIPQNWGLEKPSHAEIINIFDFLEKWPFPSKENFFSGNLISGKEVTIKDGREFNGVVLRTNNRQEAKFKIDGRHIFSCNGKVLDIYGSQYIWNNEVLELPRYQYEAMIKIQDFIFLKVSIVGLELSVWQITILPVLIFIPVYRRFVLYKSKHVSS